MPETLDRGPKLIRRIAGLFPDDNDFYALNSVPDDDAGFITFTAGRTVKDVKFTRRFFDVNDEVVAGGTFDVYLFTIDPSSDGDGRDVMFKATPLTGFADIAPIENIQETKRFGIRVSNITPPGGATYLDIWIRGNEYDRDES